MLLHLGPGCGQDRSPLIAHLRAVAVDYVLQTQIVGIASGASHIVDTFQLKTALLC